MSDGRPVDKHTTNVGNNNGSIRGYVSDSDNVQFSAKTTSNSLFPEATEFKITQEKENRTEKEKED